MSTTQSTTQTSAIEDQIRELKSWLYSVRDVVANQRSTTLHGSQLDSLPFAGMTIQIATTKAGVKKRDDRFTPVMNGKPSWLHLLKVEATPENGLITYHYHYLGGLSKKDYFLDKAKTLIEVYRNGIQRDKKGASNKLSAWASNPQRLFQSASQIQTLGSRVETLDKSLTLLNEIEDYITFKVSDAPLGIMKEVELLRKWERLSNTIFNTIQTASSDYDYGFVYSRPNALVKAIQTKLVPAIFWEGGQLPRAFKEEFYQMGDLLEG